MTQHLDDGVLHSLLDGEVRAAELPAIEAHLRGCGACRARLDEARAFRDEADRLVGEIELPAPPEDHAAAAASPGTRARPPRRIHLKPLAYAATLLAALGLGYGVRGWVREPQVGAAAADRSVLTAAPVAPSPSSLTDLVNTPPEPTPSVPRPSRGAVASRRAAPAESPIANTPREEAAPVPSTRADAPADAVAGASQAPAAPPPSLERRRLAETRQAASGQRRFEGKVTDEAGRGIGGASIVVQGTGLRALTGPDGSYRIEGDLPDSSQVHARAIGHKAVAKSVTAPDSGAVRMDFALPTEQNRLEEVVVTGVGAVSALRRPIVLRTPPPAFQTIDFAEALRRLGGRIRLVDGLVPSRLEALGDTVRLAYRVGRGREVVWLQQFRVGDTVAFALIPPAGFPADSLARLTARIKP